MIVTEGTEDRFPSGPSNDPGEDDAEEDSDGVNHYIPLRRASACDKRLVVFIAAGKGDADKTGDQHQPDTAQPIYIERKGDRYSQCKIFRHVCQLADYTVEAGGDAVDLPWLPVLTEDLAPGLDDCITYFIAQLRGSHPVLRGKAEDHIHQAERREKRERFEQRTKDSHRFIHPFCYRITSVHAILSFK